MYYNKIKWLYYFTISLHRLILKLIKTCSLLSMIRIHFDYSFPSSTFVKLNFERMPFANAPKQRLKDQASWCYTATNFLNYFALSSISTTS